MLRQPSILSGMQRLFSMFPEGWPGIGLLSLRCSVAMALLAGVYSQRQALPCWMQGTAILLSMAFFAGYMTPIAAAIALLLQGLSWSRYGCSSAAAAIIVCLDITTLALLGPGSYSIDACRFGRRVLVLPPCSSTERVGTCRPSDVAP